MDAVTLAIALLGKRLLAETPSGTLGGIITETEAYCGVTDRASHAYGGRRTARTETMYLPGGYAYVYLIYGLYACLNVTASQRDSGTIRRRCSSAAYCQATTFRCSMKTGGQTRARKSRRCRKWKSWRTAPAGYATSWASPARGTAYRSRNRLRRTGYGSRTREIRRTTRHPRASASITPERIAAVRGGLRYENN